MVWIFIPENSENSPCSQDMGDSPWPVDSPDSTPGPSAMSSMTRTPSKSYSSDSETALIPLPSGMTSRPSIPNPGADTLTSLAPGSPANHIPKPEPVGSPKDLTMIETFGPKHESAFGYWDANTSFLRTYQASFLEMMDGRAMGSVYLEIFPNWGSMQDGEFIAQPMPGRRTSGNGGLSWPTHNARDHKDTLNSAPNRQVHVVDAIRAALWPTPRAGKTTDEDEESWLARHAEGKVATPPLALAARMLPTPSSGGESGGPHGIRGGSWAKEKLVETFGEEDAVAMSGGSLSPDWVSWLMGIPLKWTSLEPLAQEDYDEWFQAQMDGTWWFTERGLPRVTTGIENRVNRLKMLGNGIVPASGALAVRDMMSWRRETIDAGVTQEEAKRRGQ